MFFSEKDDNIHPFETTIKKKNIESKNNFLQETEKKTRNLFESQYNKINDENTTVKKYTRNKHSF